MFKRLIIRKRLNKIFRVVSFKSANPQSKLYGFFKVREHENIDEEEDTHTISYEFLTYKIILNKKTGAKTFFSNGAEQIMITKFTMELKNDLDVIEVIFDKLDKNIFYYTE